MAFYHKPILLEACIASLNIRPDGIYVDATMGGGGHSVEILKRLGDGGRFIGIDQDDAALKAAGARLAEVDTRATYTTVKSNFERIAEITETLKIKALDGVLMDIGVSSHQLDEGERGFSYQQDAPLDMRMDRTADLSAYDVVNTWSREDLTRILRDYGEEKWAGRIASFMVTAREKEPIASTGQLVDIIKAAVPAAARRDGPHPAKRSFQAIRIAVNRELEVLEKALEALIPVMAPGGRIAVITFHSLEDRIVKQTVNRYISGCTCPSDFPQCVCGFSPTLRLVNRKPLVADDSELEDNPRARSAKLRVAEKL